MWSAAVVLVCALDLLGRSPEALPPITLLDAAPRAASPTAVGFVVRGERRIFLITSSDAFRTARAAQHRCGEQDALRTIASVIVHEEWHVRYGADERGAYEAQLLALIRMGADAGSSVYSSVNRAMQTVMARDRAAARVNAVGSRLSADATWSAARVR